MGILELIKLIWPLLAIQIGVQIYALIDLFKKKKTKNLSVGLWAVIIVLGEILGAVIYLLIGRAEE